MQTNERHATRDFSVRRVLIARHVVSGQMNARFPDMENPGGTLQVTHKKNPSQVHLLTVIGKD
jgi:hypothetical protein